MVKPRVNTNRWISEIHMALMLSDNGRCGRYINEFYNINDPSIQSKWDQIHQGMSKCINRELDVSESSLILNGLIDYNVVLKRHGYKLK